MCNVTNREQLIQSNKGKKNVFFPFIFFSVLFIFVSGCSVNLDPLDKNTSDDGEETATDAGNGDLGGTDGGKPNDGGVPGDGECSPQAFSPPMLSPDKKIEDVVPIVGVLSVGQMITTDVKDSHAAWLVYLSEGDYVFSLGVSDVESNRFYQSALYGPRSFDGRYGSAIAAHSNDTCASAIDISYHVITAGVYLIYVKNSADAEIGNCFIGTHCTSSCKEQSCTLDACGIVCENGFAYDEQNCVLCACKQAFCSSDMDCEEKFLCVNGQCVSEQDVTCNESYNPVCGADGKSYANNCEAERAGVTVVSQGECDTIMCSENRECPPTMICQNGICVSSGAGEAGDCGNCPHEYSPVCTELGAYPNRCLAECHNATVLYEGECEGEVDAGGGNDCSCTTEYKPVCADDGNTYGNACTAICKGKTPLYLGECRDIVCAGADELPCPPGMECEIRSKDEQKGVCVPKD